MPHIAIIVDRGQPFDRTAYILAGAARIWRDWGLEVGVYEEPSTAKDAEVAILHVDQTFVSAEYRSVSARYPKCLNRYTSDISKRTISRQLVNLKDGYEGPVIVKSNLNCGGRPEAARSGRFVGAEPAQPTFSDYTVFKSVEQVPEKVWTDPMFVVERYLPERFEGHYCLRLWTFLGAKGVQYRCHSNEQIVKGANTFWREPLSEVHQDIVKMREELGFDYGKFDFGVVDGTAVLYDANRTPTDGRTQTRSSIEARNLAIAEGIWGFLPVELRR